ncbi:cysteine-rich motor neuron 1 protein-like isoform X2 [Watersipora subatra]|uniref:cysteine-rich motor neuron 1 protein-like isoform X2 n=1 Tax=Watersipora subatra TaxID=2589382 RepID=UPI00355B3245
MVLQSSSLFKSIIVLLCLSLVVDAVAVGRRRGDGCRGRRGPPGRNCQEDSDCGQDMVCCGGSCQPGVRSSNTPVSRWSPTNSCREFDCLGLCSHGWATNTRGCRLGCVCETCPRIDCNLDCEHGYRNDVSVCPVCACNPPPKICEVLNCTERGISCPNFFLFGEDGCQVGCTCFGCPRLDCETLSCPINGFAVDANNCPICECARCPRLECNLNCEHGYRTGVTGCPVCACNPPPGGCEVFNCVEKGITCPNGFVFGVDGCQLGCGCDGCPRLENCDISCPHSFATDAESCPICACNPPPGGCEMFNCVERGISCPNGFVFGVDGCQLGCGCDGCPRLECDSLSCPLRGFAVDANSCPICSCNSATYDPENFHPWNTKY